MPILDDIGHTDLMGAYSLITNKNYACICDLAVYWRFTSAVVSGANFPRSTETSEVQCKRRSGQAL